MTKFKWKSIVKKAIKTNYENELKSKMTTSKLKDGPMNKESFGLQDYLKEMRLSDARTKFRSNMTKVKMNMKSDPKFAAELWKCSGCGQPEPHYVVPLLCPSEGGPECQQ